MTSSVVTLPLTDAGAPPASEDDWATDLRIPYFRAKGESERKAWQLARELGLDLTTILPAGIIGPGFPRPTPTIVKPPLLVLPTFVAPLLPAYDASEPARHHDRYNERQMAVRVVRLGTPRAEDEGLRIGTVRRPPRGVSKSEFARQNWYDVWFPNLAPSVETMKLGQRAATPAQWSAFFRKYRAEMAAPENSRAIALLAALSHQSNFSVGCYCEAESHCHRSVLRELLASHGARLRPPVR